MIAILCPTRGRPEQAKRMKDSVNGKAYVYFVGSSEDRQSYVDLMGDPLTNGYHYVVLPDNMPTAAKWNFLAEWLIRDSNGWSRLLSHRLFMLGSDDMYFTTPGWDKALIDHYSLLENKTHVYALRDSRDPLGTPHPIVTREYIESLGYFVPPIFLHWFVDTWTVEIAKSNERFTHFTEFTLVHDKPSDRGQPDETHSRIREWGWHERDKYVAEKMSHILEYEKIRLGQKMLISKESKK